jgi:hypothetical protein
MKMQIEFKLADMWVGAFWQRRGNTLHIWICILPCLPLHLQIGVE